MEKHRLAYLEWQPIAIEVSPERILAFNGDNNLVNKTMASIRRDYRTSLHAAIKDRDFAPEEMGLGIVLKSGVAAFKNVVIGQIVSK